MLAQLRTRDGAGLDLTLTTNGSLLKKKAQSLRDAGLTRLTVSLDALDETVFQRMNDVDFPVADVLEGIAHAQSVGFGGAATPIKVNMVVKRGVNQQEILPMARHFKGSGQVLRFIEYMDVGSTNRWCMDEVVASAQVRQIIEQVFPLHAAPGQRDAATAERWLYADGSGELGFISSVSQAFCSDCTRARLSTEGKLFLCLFGQQGHDLRDILRSSAFATDATLLTKTVAAIWQGRTDRYSVLRSQASNGVASAEAALALVTPAGKRVEMSYIGG
jgi:GTP 3',8-cyclase